MTNATMRKKWLISAYTSRSQSIIERNQVAGEAKAMEEHCLLAGLLVHAQPVCLYNPSPPANGWCHSQWAGPSLVNHLINLIKGSLQLRFPLPRCL